MHEKYTTNERRIATASNCKCSGGRGQSLGNSRVNCDVSTENTAKLEADQLRSGAHLLRVGVVNKNI